MAGERVLIAALRAQARRMLDNPLGDRLRNAVGYNPPTLLRPMGRRTAISDLFLYRGGQNWETVFPLTNIPSYLFPDAAGAEQATMVFFATDGREIGRRTLDLAPFETKSIDLRSAAAWEGDTGGFAVFHHGGAADRLAESGSFVVDRLYTGFRRPGDDLWSFVHGNSTGLAMDMKGGKVFSLASRSRGMHRYRPQLAFDDCRRFELAFANYGAVPVRIELSCLDRDGSEIAHTSNEVPPRGCWVFSGDHGDGPVAMVEHRANLPFFRPLIFKEYASHFSVMHG